MNTDSRSEKIYARNEELRLQRIEIESRWLAVLNMRRKDDKQVTREQYESAMEAAHAKTTTLKCGCQFDNTLHQWASECDEHRAAG